MTDTNEDRGRSRRSGADDRGWSSIGWILDGQTIERSGDIVCGLHRTQGDKEHMFLGLASKSRSMVFPGLASKLVASSFPVYGSKPVASVW
jgi:hypothetical protein